MKIINYSNFASKLFLFLIFLIIVFPKINIIILPFNLHQGIRMEDLVLLVYLFYLIMNIQNLVLKKNSTVTKFLFFFPFFIFSIFNGFLNNINQYWVFLPRFIEYVFLIFLLENFVNNRETAVKICKYTIFVNFFIIILQINNIVGGFTSVQYFEAGSKYMSRPFGLTGGAWEVGAIFSICYIIIHKFNEKKNSIENIFFLAIVLFTLYLCETRGTIIAFSLTLFFLFKSFRIKLLLIIFLLFSVLFIFPSNGFLNTLLKLNPLILFNYFLFFLENGYANEDMFKYNYYYSLGLRFNHIAESFSIWKDNISTILFGIGFNKIYMDSFYLRSLISFGLVGSIIVFILSLTYLPFILLVFLGISGLTLDHIFSFKIFTLVILYIHLTKMKTNEK